MRMILNTRLAVEVSTQTVPQILPSHIAQSLWRHKSACFVHCFYADADWVYIHAITLYAKNHVYTQHVYDRILLEQYMPHTNSHQPHKTNREPYKNSKWMSILGYVNAYLFFIMSTWCHFIYSSYFSTSHWDRFEVQIHQRRNENRNKKYFPFT